MIYTALPFGYLVIYGFLFGCILIGLLLLGIAIFTRKFVPGLVGLILFLSTGGVLILDTLLKARMDWNPRIESDAAIIGTWTAKDRVLLINADQTFKYTEGPIRMQGTWSRYDWNLYLHSATEDKTMRFIRNGTPLRIMTNPAGDPDAWDGDLGLKQSGCRPR